MSFVKKYFFFSIFSLLVYAVSATKAMSLPAPGVSCVNKYTGDKLQFYCEKGLGIVWYNDEVFGGLRCQRLPSTGPGERGPYGGQIGSEDDDIYLSFGLGSYGQRVHGRFFDKKIVAHHWDYCRIN